MKIKTNQTNQFNFLLKCFVSLREYEFLKIKDICIER